jgi:anaerobic magnesium-protoporphyrin IX monomethyl ester cyclase
VGIRRAAEGFSIFDIRKTIVQLVNQLQPDLVGLSIMTFQRKTAKAIIDLIRALKQNVKIVVGGYDPPLSRPA